jgi:ion channel POLLUX/CASTOR
METGHFLVLGWSEKIYSVIDQISEAYATKHITVVVMGEDDKLEMEGKLKDKIVHQDRIKLVVRSGSSMNLNDLSRVSFAQAQAIVVLVDDKDADSPDKADGRIIKTLLAIYNHPDEKLANVRVTAEVMNPASQEIAAIASGGRAEIVKTNEIISKILLQTSRISGLSLVYDELLRFEGNEMHVKQFPVAGRKFGELLLDFPNGLVVGTSKLTSVGHTLNPPADYVMQPDDGLLILAEDANVQFQPRGPINLAAITIPQHEAEKPVEHLLILGWNAKIFPIIEEFDNYVGEGSSVTLVNSIPMEERVAMLTEKCPVPKKIQVHHLVGEFTNRKLMEQLQPQRYPTVMVLADAGGEATVEESDTRAIIALLLLRDFRQRHGITEQEVCSEILDPKNRELAATTEIRDVVISKHGARANHVRAAHSSRVGGPLPVRRQRDLHQGHWVLRATRTAHDVRTFDLGGEGSQRSRNGHAGVRRQCGATLRSGAQPVACATNDAVHSEEGRPPHRLGRGRRLIRPPHVCATLQRRTPRSLPTASARASVPRAATHAWQTEAASRVRPVSRCERQTRVRTYSSRA